MLPTDPIPGAAMQFAEALAKSMRHKPFTEERVEYWSQKTEMLADIYNISRPFLDELCNPDRPRARQHRHRDFDHKTEAENVVVAADSGALAKRPSLALRLAVRASTWEHDPLAGTGILAFSPHPAEARFFHATLHDLYELTEACEAKSFELLAGLLAIALPGLRGDRVPDETLIAAGLPEKEPSPNY